MHEKTPTKLTDALIRSPRGKRTWGLGGERSKLLPTISVGVLFNRLKFRRVISRRERLKLGIEIARIELCNIVENLSGSHGE